MLFFKQKTLLAVLLFIIVLVFAFISQYQTFVPYEGFEDNVPICQNKDNDVPGCYNVELNDGPVEFSNYSEDYVLKTQIVPPVCPSCPTMFSEHNHGKVNGKINGNNVDNLSTNANNGSEENNIINSGNETNVSVQETNLSNNEETNVLNNEETNVSNEENNINQEQQYSTVYNVTNNTNSNNSSSTPILGGSLLGGGNNNSSNSQYENEIARLKNELSKLKQSGNSSKNGNCPPCPPCDRCPEPAFTCEKVINYRSQNVGNYLPLPVLNDFSTF